MNPRQNNSLTLLELIIAMVLLSLVVLSFSSMDIFSRFEVLSSDRRAKLHNEVSYVLEHMTKEISKAVGSAGISWQVPISNETILGDIATITAYIDYDRDGRADRLIAYRLTTFNEIQYCPSCMGFPCNTCDPSWGSTEENILSKKITNFIPGYNSSNNYVDVSLTACYDPDGTPYACGTRDNPNVTMQTRIKLPSVSTH